MKKTAIGSFALIALALCFFRASGDADLSLLPKTGAFHPLTEPACSYASTQNRKGFVKLDDRAVAWIRSKHNGGAIPIRFFLSATRVINDTYGLFFYDPDGGYVSAYKKDYGYEFYGWERGVMIVKSQDGTLWSALSGRALKGPQKGRQLERIPSMLTTWGHWLMLHPESTAYDLFDGKKYPATPIPSEMSPEAQKTMGKVDPRLRPLTPIMGVEVNGETKAFPLDEAAERACFVHSVGGQELAVFWYQPTQSAVAFYSKLGDRRLTFYADPGSPETAPFKDKETESRWTLAGRAVDGPLKGQELTWVNSVQCRWYAWVAGYPKTDVYVPSR